MTITNGVYRGLDVILNTSNGFAPRFILIINYVNSSINIKTNFQNNKLIKTAFNINIDAGDKSHYPELMWINEDKELIIYFNKISNCNDISLFDYLGSTFKSIDKIIDNKG